MRTADENMFLMILLGLALVFLGIFGGLVVQVIRRQKKQPRELDSAAPEVSPQVTTAEPVVESQSLKQALAQTEKSIFGRLRSVFSNELAQKNLDEVEEILFTSDIGPQTVQRLLRGLEKELSKGQKQNLDLVRSSLRQEFQEIFTEALNQEPLANDPFSTMKTKDRPTVWMVVGVNGAGKTTSIGKIAALLAQNGLRVLVAAGDTFRAAAGGQLKVWTDRAQVEIFSPDGVKDPSAVAFDAVAKAKAQGYDLVIVDTAGRLHTQVNLMEELKKMKRVMGKALDGAPHETLIVLDANSGQNALVQAREFHQALTLTGVVITKMDGTAKGGVAVGLAHELKVPIRFIGIGEKIGDLKAFSSREFIESIIT